MMGKILLPILMMCLITPALSEVPGIYITPKKPDYKGVKFQVLYKEQVLMHNQFKSYYVVIYVNTGKRKNIDKDGWIEVWHDSKFVYGNSLSQSSRKHIPYYFSEKIPESSNELFFFFTINPEYIEQTWFNYQIRNDDDRIVMNCTIHLKDFISKGKESSNGSNQ